MKTIPNIAKSPNDQDKSWFLYRNVFSIAKVRIYHFFKSFYDFNLSKNSTIECFRLLYSKASVAKKRVSQVFADTDCDMALQAGSIYNPYL